MRRRSLSIRLLCAVALLIGVVADAPAGQLLMNPAVPGVTTHRLEPMVNATDSAVDADFARALRGYITQELGARNLLATEGVEADREVVLVVTEYRMRTPWDRILLGAIAGRDSIATEVRVVHVASGRTLGETLIHTTRRMAISSDDAMARRHAEAVVQYLLDGR